jgi:outer membrane protein
MAEEGPSMAQARAESDAAGAARRSAWTAYLPSVTTSYSRAGNGVGNSVLPAGDALDYSGSLRFSLSLPLFNQFQREEQLTGAQVAEQNAVASLRDARLAARENLVRSLGAFRFARERVGSQAATLESAEEDLRMQQQRYALGSATLLDVLTSQTTLDQARRDLIRARYDERIAKAQLEALLGRDL